MSLSDYFTQEAGEFLDQLDALLAGGGTPDGERFFRVARGVRGSAQIAGAAGVAGVAESLEDVGRALRDRSITWSEELRGKVVETVADLRALVPVVGTWSDAEQARADAALARLDGSAAHRRDPGEGASITDLLDFVRREVGAVAQEIGGVLNEIRMDPTAREPLRVLLRRMRPVRGVTGHPTLAPVLEVLEGVEDACGDLLGRSGPAGPVPVALLGAARESLDAAIGRMSVGAELEAMPELEAFRTARERLDGEEPGDPTVIPISQLFGADSNAHIVSSPTAPVRDLEGDGMADDVVNFLRIEATGFLDQAEGLIAASEADPRRRLGRIARQLSELATGVRELAATYGMTRVADAADDAATRLRRAGSHAEAREALRGLRDALPGSGPANEEQAPSAAAPTPQPEVAVSSQPQAQPAAPVAAPQAETVVPVESLLYTPADALQEAIQLRSRIEGMVGPAGRVGAPLGDVIDELFGLLTLARGIQPTG